VSDLDDLLVEAAQRGVKLYRDGDRVRFRVRGTPPPDLIERLRAHRSELLEAIRGQGPHTWPAASGSGVCGDGGHLWQGSAPAWVIAGGAGEMRLVVEAEPPWPAAVLRAAALVEVIDRRHRDGRDREAAQAAEELERVLDGLGRQGVAAWLTS
jgi:hypothetical protein